MHFWDTCIGIYIVLCSLELGEKWHTQVKYKLITQRGHQSLLSVHITKSTHAHLKH